MSSYFQRTQGNTATVQGGGDSKYFEDEAAFIGYYGAQLAGILGAGDLKAALIEEGTQSLAIGYVDGGALRGVVRTSNADAESVLAEIDWQRL